MNSSGEKPPMFWSLLFLSILVVFCVYLPVLNNGFVNWDDGVYIQGNYFIRHLNRETLSLIFSHSYIGYWVPLTWLSLSLDYHFGKLDPEIYHMHNLILHCLNTVLVFLISFRILYLARKDAYPGHINRGFLCMLAAFIAALIFGIHPLHVESVAWATERKDVLYGLFYLLSILAYLYHAVRPTQGLYWVCFCFFLLSLAAKPMAITLPLVLLLLDYWPFGNIQTGFLKAVKGKLPFLATSMVSVAITLESYFKTPQGTIIVPLAFRTMNALHSLAFYLVKLVFPVGLRAFYPVVLKNTFSFEYICAALSALAIFYFAWTLRKKFPFLFMAWFYYFLTLAPVLGFFQAGPHASADRDTYISALSPILLFSVFLVNLFAKRWLFLILPVFILTTLLVYETYGQIGTWKDSYSLWMNVLRVQPRNASLVYANLADTHENSGLLDYALSEYETAIRIGPPLPAFYDGHASVLLKKGAVDQAIQDFKTAIPLDPNYCASHYGLALAYLQKGMYQDALMEAETSLRINPNDSASFKVLGDIYHAQNNYKSSIASYEKALSLEPNQYNPAYLRDLRDACMDSVNWKKPKAKQG